MVYNKLTPLVKRIQLKQMFLDEAGWNIENIVRVVPEGLEPSTYCLEGSCSIHWATEPEMAYLAGKNCMYAASGNASVAVQPLWPYCLTTSKTAPCKKLQSESAVYRWKERQLQWGLEGGSYFSSCKLCFQQLFAQGLIFCPLFDQAKNGRHHHPFDQATS